MKSILVPTDFSTASRNAIDYAVEIALSTEAKLILFHAYHVPVITTDLPVVVPSLDEMEADTMTSLVRIQNQLHIKHGYNLEIECKSVCGFAADTIEKYAENQNADLIVMGMRGMGMIEEKLIGSVTTSVIHESKRPVMVIDENMKFKAPKKILLAADYGEVLPAALQPLRKIANLYDAHIYILNVVKETKVIPETKQAAAGIKLDHALQGNRHSFHYQENNDIIEGLNEFISTHEIDMVTMVPRQHSLLEKIFTGSTTKRMAFHSAVPLLTLHN